jgi:FkbM family methyltransferase
MPRGIRKVDWWWERLYRSIGGGGFEANEPIDSRWPTGERAPVRSRRFGYRVSLNLQAFAERRTYFSGECPQQEMEYLFAALLRVGDQYLDVGANIGMMALMANSLIGRRGRGFAFEPNPAVFPRLKRHFELNGVSNIEPLPYALSNREGDTYLIAQKIHSCGDGWLATDFQGEGRKHTVRTILGRGYLERLDPNKPTTIKIDVEGHEVKVLKGFEDTLERRELAIVCEVNEAMLRRAGDSSAALYQAVAKYGFRTYTFEVRRSRFRARLAITECKSFLEARHDDLHDVLFAKPDSRIYAERIAPYMASD